MSTVRPATVLAAALLASACAHRGEVAISAPSEAPPPRPVLASEFAAVTPPPRDADGRYRTINAGLDRDGTIWHVRAALNVAAIGCRGPDDAGTIAAYNAMLTSKKALLARANKSFEASFKGTAADPRAASDVHMTRLYNFFALPAAKPAFCKAAAALAPEAAATAPDAFPAFADAALPALEAPFVAVYRQVDEYRLASAQWDARYGPDAVPEKRLASNASDARAAKAKHAAAPMLAYADLGTVIAWQPRRGEALASR